jgi:hypothetical protein
MPNVRISRRLERKRKTVGLIHWLNFVFDLLGKGMFIPFACHE